MQRMSSVALAFPLALALAAAPARPDSTPGPSPRLAVPAPPAPAPAAAPARTDAQLVAAVHALVDSLTAAGDFSGAVLLAHGDRTLVREARGLADRERGLRNQPNTLFNLGSINKKLTEIAIRQLAAQGRLALTDTIARYLPDYPADKGRRITLQELLDHRAGTGDIFNDRFRATDPARLRTLADWMDLIRDQPLEFEPGTRQAYSNAGYVLLGAIVERVTGESYFDYVQAHVYAPAGMAASGSFARDEPAPNRAVGYTRRDAPGGALRPNTAGLPGRGSSAGGGYSTVDDLRRLVAALRAGRLGIAPDSSDFLIAGGSPGVNAALGAVGGYTLVVLANLDPPAAVGLASRLERWLPRRGGGGARVEVGGEGDRRGRPGITRVPPGGTSVAMDTSHPLPTLMVRVNGQGPFRFGLDTGGAGSARVDSALAARLGLRTVGEVRAGDPSGRGLVTLPLVAVDSIRVGGALFGDLTAAVRSYASPARGEPVDGILGFGLFADGLLTLDYPAARLEFAAGALPPANGDDVLEFTGARGIPQVALDVAGHAVRADLDAGSMGGFSLPESLAAALPLASPPRVIGHARTISNSFDVKGAGLAGEIRLGGLRFTNPMVEFQPLFPNANVGARVLKDLRLTFDQRHGRVKLERAPAPGGEAR